MEKDALTCRQRDLSRPGSLRNVETPDRGLPSTALSDQQEFSALARPEGLRNVDTPETG